MAYIGNTATTQAFTPAVDYFNGDGATVAFTLSKPVASVAQVQAVIENVPQNPGSAYTVSGSTITFTSAPPSGTANIYVYYTSPITQVIAPSQGTVGSSQLQSDLDLTGSLTVDGTTLVVDDTNNRVGIGTSSPANPLDIVGNDGVVVRRPGQTNGFIFRPTATGDGGRFSLEGTGDLMQIDSSGRVTMPYQPAFHARKTNETSVGTGNVIASWNEVVTNLGSHFNGTNGVFTAPVSGVYQLNFTGISYINSNTDISIRVNGSAVAYTYAYVSGSYLNLSMGVARYMAAGDSADVFVNNGSVYTAGDGGSPRFSGYLVG